MAGSGGFWRTLVQDIKARFRGEERVAPRGTRGRVYQKKQKADSGGGSAIGVRPQPEATLTITVTRADGTVESQTVPAHVTEVKSNG